MSDPNPPTTTTDAARALGSLGGRARTAEKARAARANGAAGGRPSARARFRAVCVASDWQGLPRCTIEAAEADAARHRLAAAKSWGGYSRAIVVMRDGDRCQYLDGAPVWPNYGRGNGALRWR